MDVRGPNSEPVCLQLLGLLSLLQSSPALICSDAFILYTVWGKGCDRFQFPVFTGISSCSSILCWKIILSLAKQPWQLHQLPMTWAAGSHVWLCLFCRDICLSLHQGNSVSVSVIVWKREIRSVSPPSLFLLFQVVLAAPGSWHVKINSLFSAKRPHCGGNWHYTNTGSSMNWEYLLANLALSFLLATV